MGLQEQMNALDKGRFSELLEHLKRRAVFLIDPSGNILSANKDAENLIGSIVHNLYGLPFFSLYNILGVKQDDYLHALDVAAESGSFIKEETCIQQGEKFHLVTHLLHLPGIDGKAGHYSLVLTIMPQHANQLTNALHLAGLVERTTDPIFSTDTDFKITSWNNAAEKIYGYKKSEAIGQPLRAILRPQMKEEVFAEIDESMKQKGSWIGEATHLSKTGILIDVEESISLTKDGRGNVDGYVWVCRDITAIKKNEHEKLKLLKLLENTTDGMYTATKNNLISSWNHAAERMYGYKAAEVIGQRIEEVLQPQVQSEMMSLIRSIIAKTGRWKGEVVHKKKDGSLIPVLISVNVVHESDGEISEFLCVCTDITEVKQSQEALGKMQEAITRLTQERLDKSLREIKDYRYALDASCLVVITDAQGYIKYANNNFCERSLYDAAELTTGNYHMMDAMLFHKAEKGRIWETISGGNIWKGEVKNKGKEDSFFWEEATIVPFLNESNKPYQYLKIGVDITEKKKAEEAYRHSEEMRSLIFRSAFDAIIGVSSEGKIIMWNIQAEKIFGWSQADTLGKDFEALIIPERHRMRDRNILDKYIHTGQSEVFNKVLEVNLINSAGKEFPVEFAIIPIKQGNHEFFCAFIRDNTQRKLWEKELQDAAQKYKMLFDNNPLPMWMFTLPERSIIEVNKAACEHYGYTREEFLNLSVLDMRPKEEVPRFLEDIKQMSPEVRTAGVWVHKKKNGDLIKVEIFKDDIVYKGKQVRLVLANDITEKLLTEDKLKESHNALRDLASHLQDIREEERAVIAREIHDELGQQITGLKMDVSWIAKRLQTEEQAVHQKVKSVLNLLDETVKTVRKIATELRPSILDDLGLIDALQWYSLEFEKRFAITISFRTAVEDIKVSKHTAIGLFRIYQESLTNVARHAQASFVLADISIHDNQIILTIKDNGKGFDADITGNKKTLGLLGMKERTLMMGGTYEIDSRLGAGTTVTVSVPLLTEKPLEK